MNSKFQRVPGKMGWFRLKDPFSSRPSITPILLPMSCDGKYSAFITVSCDCHVIQMNLFQKL